MRPTRAQVLGAVLGAPLGLTTHEIAAKLGSTAHQVSTTVSKLAAYAAIDKELIPGSRQSFRWKRKPE